MGSGVFRKLLNNCLSASGIICLFAAALLISGPDAKARNYQNNFFSVIKVMKDSGKTKRSSKGLSWKKKRFFWNKKKQAKKNKRPRRNIRRAGKRRATKRIARKTVEDWGLDKIPDGPLQLVISLPEQKVIVYKDGNQVATSKVSTGRSSHPTPAGIFSIIEKQRTHFSNLYDSAPMPYMQRITWSGVALHQGYVPNYPASHGCIRLPRSFARKLYSLPSKGAHVVIAQNNAVPVQISHPNLFQLPLMADLHKGEAVKSASVTGFPVRLAMSMESSSDAIPYIVKAGLKVTDEDPAAAYGLADTEAVFNRMLSQKSRSKKPLRILITRSSNKEKIKDAQRKLKHFGYYNDKIDGIAGRRTRAAIKKVQYGLGLKANGRISPSFISELYRITGQERSGLGHLYVRQNFRDVFDAPIKITSPGKELGAHLFTALHFDETDASIKWTALTLKDNVTAHEALSRIEIPSHVRSRISYMLTPGTSVVISDSGMSNDTGRGTDFIVLTK